jgi:hypothetical protein
MTSSTPVGVHFLWLTSISVYTHMDEGFCDKGTTHRLTSSVAAQHLFSSHPELSARSHAKSIVPVSLRHLRTQESGCRQHIVDPRQLRLSQTIAARIVFKALSIAVGVTITSVAPQYKVCYHAYIGHQPR